MKNRLYNTSLIHAGAGRKALHVFTAYVFGVWAFKILIDPLYNLSRLPNEMADPVGILNLMPAEWIMLLVTEPALWGIKIVGLVCCLCSMVPRLIRGAGPVACLAITLQESLIRSFGIVNHPEVALIITAYVLVLFAWYREMSVGENATEASFNQYAVPMVTVALILTVAYSLVGLNRLYFDADGGPYMFASETLPNYIYHRTLSPNLFGFEIGKSVSDWPWLMVVGTKMGFFISTLVEITAPLCLISRYYRYFFLTFMVSFHVIILLTMNISFAENVLLYVVLVDFSRWILE
jgi:hypothetical protein